MKKLALLLLAASFVLPLMAQDKDTTKIKMGKKRIIIIEENIDGTEENKLFDSEVDKLENGRIEFEDQIKEMEAELEAMKEKMESIEGENDSISDKKRAKIKKKMEEKRKAIEALEKGIESIESEIDKIEEHADVLEDEDFNFDIEEDIESKIEKGLDFEKKEKDFEGHWAGFEFGLNNFMNADYQLQLPDDGQFMELNTSKSWGFNLNIVEYAVPVIPHYVGLVTGLGFEWNNYHFEKDITLGKDESGNIIAEDSDKNWDKNTLNTTYLTAPLLIEFQVPTGKKDKPLYLNGGVVGGIKLGSKIKQKVEKVKNKNKGDFQLAPFRAGLTARMGYRAINVFATYYFIELFEKNKGPELYPFTAGLAISFN